MAEATDLIGQLNDLSDEELRSFLATLPDDYFTNLEAQTVQGSDSPGSFFAFYRLITGIDAPAHVKAWINFIYGSKSRDRGSLLWAFRGSWKTTSLTIMFTAYRIGKEPHKANLILQANDDSANKTAAAIANIIDRHPGWKLCFPHVVPDKGKGWSMAGYEVMRTDMDYGAWVAMCATRKDPTLLGLGYASRSVIGKHPDGVLAIDDIHDETNSSSARERANVIQTLTDTIFPLVVEDVTKNPGQRLVTWEIIVGTPWTEDDAYHYIRSTGEFDFYKTPVMELSFEGAPGATFFDHKGLKGWYKLVWPDRFTPDVIVSWYNKSALRGFGRMYMLDLDIAQDVGLRYHSYPHEHIDLTWPAGGGVDYASTIEIRGKVIDTKERSKFAICWGVKLPTGGACIVDGFSGFISQLEGENKVETGQNMFPNFLITGVEMNGVGAQFFALLQRKPHLKLLPYWTGKDSKRDRHERELSPWLEAGMIRISDKDTPFLNTLRKALREWPHGSMDEIDALYAYAKTIPDVLAIPNYEERLPSYMPKQKIRMNNPFTAFGSSDRR